MNHLVRKEEHLNNYFICPKCKSQLMAGDKVVMSAKAKDESEGLLYLSPELGNYNVDFPSTLNYKKGELLTLYCPVCHQNLASPKHINLAMIMMTNDAQEEYEIFFSQIVGEHSTLVMMGDHVDLYGEHADKYQDLFNTRQMF